MSAGLKVSIPGTDAGATTPCRASVLPVRQAQGPEPVEGQTPPSASLNGVCKTDALQTVGSSAPLPSSFFLHPFALLGLLQSGDSFYPTGSYAHSFGLEGLVHEGVIRDRATLREYLFRSALPTLQRADLPLLAHAWRAFGAADWPAIGELCVLSSALKTAREARIASENIGRQRAELCASLHPDSLATEYLSRVNAAGWPHAATVSAALEARVLGAPLEAAMAGYTYSSLSSLLAAAMKLLRLGQNGAQTLLAEALAAAPALMDAATATPRTEIGWFNPWLDIAAARHESADARMFMS